MTILNDNFLSNIEITVLILNHRTICNVLDQLTRLEKEQIDNDTLRKLEGARNRLRIELEIRDPLQ